MLLYNISRSAHLQIRKNVEVQALVTTRRQELENSRSQSPLYDAFINAVHDELIETYIFYKFDTLAHICVEKITWEVKKYKCENHQMGS